MNRKTKAALVLAALAGLCAEAQGEVSFKKDIQPILNKQCTGCHGDKKQKAGLDLSEGRAFANLKASSKQDSTMVLVKPSEPEQSYLWLKLEGRAKTGTSMPRGLFGGKTLPKADLDIIKAWIAGGAKE